VLTLSAFGIHSKCYLLRRWKLCRVTEMFCAMTMTDFIVPSSWSTMISTPRQTAWLVVLNRFGVVFLRSAGCVKRRYVPIADRLSMQYWCYRRNSIVAYSYKPKSDDLLIVLYFFVVSRLPSNVCIKATRVFTLYIDWQCTSRASMPTCDQLIQDQRTPYSSVILLTSV